ncbi:MAG: hypothetical protein GQ548_03820 [Methylophaga sp.]|nr:hypothetical protein [Methylophaga sp.]
MLVQQSIQTQIGLTQEIPLKLLADLVIGQRLEAVVMASVAASEIVSIKIADSLLDIRSPTALQVGQRIQLELVMENGKPVLKLASLSTTESPSLKPGQQVAVEVIKILAENRVLVQTLIAKDSPAQSQLAPLQQQRFDIDLSQLTQRHKIGDKLVMNIVAVNPLNIQLRPELPQSREQIILERIQQLLPQQSINPTLDKVISSFHKQQFPELVQKAVQQLFQHTLDKTELTQPQAFKQALSFSGSLMENKLLSQPNQATQDFKANVLKVLKAVETVVLDVKGQTSEKAINKLPAQVQAALTTNGKTPTQLINVLLSGKSLPTLLSGLNNPTLLPVITSQQQATSLIQLLNKPLVPLQTTVKGHVAMDLIELMRLFKEVEGVHNKLQLNQLNMLKEPESSSTVASWLFDIPIKDKQALDLLHVHIEQQRKQSEAEDDDVWNVKLRLDTQNLGPVQATVTLHNEDVKIVIRAEREESAQLLEEHLTLLTDAIASLGVSISHSSCSCGVVDKSIAVGQEHYQSTKSSLLDVSV